MLQDLFIIGATGRVGKTLVQQIFDKKDNDSSLHENPTRIVALTSHSSSSFIYNPKGISHKRALEFQRTKLGFHPSHPNVWLEKVCQDYNPNDESKRITFVDVSIGQKDMLDFHSKVIEGTPYRIVTANKTPLEICSLDTFQRLTREPNRYGYRCSVMAGAEAVNKIRDLKDLGDPLVEISGCFSGTLGYIAFEFEKNRKLSEIVGEARKIGYTETHPRDDLSGLDVARKLIILGRTAGYDIKPIIDIDPFIPIDYFGEDNVEKFLESLETLDDEFRIRVDDARAKGNVLRYVANLGFEDGMPKASVGLREIPQNSLLGRLQGTMNKIIVKTKNYESYSVEAPGAGLEITAQNIRRDLLAQIPDRVVNYN